MNHPVRIFPTKPGFFLAMFGEDEKVVKGATIGTGAVGLKPFVADDGVVFGLFSIDPPVGTGNPIPERYHEVAPDDCEFLIEFLSAEGLDVVIGKLLAASEWLKQKAGQSGGSMAE